MRNRYAGKCYCGAAVAPNAGTVLYLNGKWVVRCVAHSPPQPARRSFRYDPRTPAEKGVDFRATIAVLAGFGFLLVWPLHLLFGIGGKLMGWLGGAALVYTASTVLWVGPGLVLLLLRRAIEGFGKAGKTSTSSVDEAPSHKI